MCDNFDQAVDTPDRGVFEEGQTTTCQFTVTVAPQSPVHVYLRNITNRMRFEPSDFIITPDDWTQPRTITLTVPKDDYVDPKRDLTFIVPIVVSGDHAFTDAVASATKQTYMTGAEKDPNKNGFMRYPRFFDRDRWGFSGFNSCWDIVIDPNDHCAAGYAALVEVLDPWPDELVEVVPGSRLRAVEGGLPAVVWIRLKGRPRVTVTVTVDSETSDGPTSFHERAFDYLGTWRRSFDSTNWNVPQPMVFPVVDDQARATGCCDQLSFSTVEGLDWLGYEYSDTENYGAWGGNIGPPAGADTHQYFRHGGGATGYRIVDDDTRKPRKKRNYARCFFGMFGELEGIQLSRYPVVTCDQTKPRHQGDLPDGVFRHQGIWGLHTTVFAFVPHRGWLRLGQNDVLRCPKPRPYQWGSVNYVRALPRNATRLKIHVDASRWTGPATSSYVINPKIGAPVISSRSGGVGPDPGQWGAPRGAARSVNKTAFCNPVSK